MVSGAGGQAHDATAFPNNHVKKAGIMEGGSCWDARTDAGSDDVHDGHDVDAKRPRQRDDVRQLQSRTRECPSHVCLQPYLLLYNPLVG